MKEANNAVATATEVPDALKCLVFEHPFHGDVYYEIHQKDAKLLHEFVCKRPYTLALVDIPYGFNLPECLHEDSVPWGATDLSAMIQSFKIVTTARIWRIVVMHSCQQLGMVDAVLKQECNAGLQTCCW
jgi:hypothetical protein